MGDIINPTFIVGGAPKSGTTSLYYYLDQHPQICMSARKETDTFTGENFHGLEWLSENYYRHYSGEPAIGEASSSILQDPRSVERIRDTLPNVGLIFILRDPVDRLHSHFKFLQSKQVMDSSTSFSHFIRSESARRDILVDLGRYYKHLSRFEQHFDRKQMLVLFFEDFVSDTARVLKRIYRFVDVDPSFRPRLEVRNPTREPRFQNLHYVLTRIWEFIRDHLDVYVANRTRYFRRAVKRLITRESTQKKISQRDKSYLREIYRVHNQKIEKWAERDLSHWT